MIPAAPSSLSHPAVPPSAALKPFRPAASSEGGVLGAFTCEGMAGPPPAALPFPSQPSPGGDPSPAGAGGFPGSEDVEKRFRAAVADTRRGAALKGAFRQTGRGPGGPSSPESPTGTHPALLHSLVVRKCTSHLPEEGLAASPCLGVWPGLCASPAL